MYHRVRKKMHHFLGAILILSIPLCLSKSIDTTSIPDDSDNNIIDFDDEYTLKFNKKYGMVPWHANEFGKNSLRYTIDKDINKDTHTIPNTNTIPSAIKQENNYRNKTRDETTTEDFKVIPLELLSTTEDPVLSLVESTKDDLTVIPLPTTETLRSTTDKVRVTIEETMKLPSTENDQLEFDFTTKYDHVDTSLDTTTETNVDYESTMAVLLKVTNDSEIKSKHTNRVNDKSFDKINAEDARSLNISSVNTSAKMSDNITLNHRNKTNERKNIQLKNKADQQTPNMTTQEPSIITDTDSKEEDVPVFTELDTEIREDIPEDYYDLKDKLPTSAPKTDAISVLFGLAGSVVESVVETVAERVVPKSLYDLFKRMQRQGEALEAERLRSREENGGLGQFGRGILKTISTGLSKPLGQLMESRANGSLDTDRGFVAGVASSVTSVANVANSVVEAFKDKVQAVYPGTIWCGDGRSAQARSSDLGLFFFTDTCCRQHDACKIYILAGQTKYGLTNTGLFTRSHCSCDMKFRECLHRTSSLVSAQIGLTYFNVLGPQCFRKAHPIVRCTKKTRLTGQKCEEYELDYTKPKMWQWFDNETF